MNHDELYFLRALRRCAAASVRELVAVIADTDEIDDKYFMLAMDAQESMSAIEMLLSKEEPSDE